VHRLSAEEDFNRLMMFRQPTQQEAALVLTAVHGNLS
jgi:hypothetical protein